MTPGARAYLTIVEWPHDVLHPKRVEALVSAVGLDPFHADAAVARGTPGIVAVIDPLVAPEALRPLREAGATAIAPGDAEIEACSHRLAAKSLERMDEGETFLVHAWRGPGRVLRAGRVVLLARGRIAMNEVSTQTDSIGPRLAGLAIGGVYGAAMSMSSSTVTTRQTRLAEALDLYDLDGPPVRIDGRKFNFDVLGKKGYSDRENLDKLAALLLSCRSEGALPCELDQGFAQWHAPTHLSGQRVPVAGEDGSVRRRDETRAFDFYSAWRFLVWRSQRGTIPPTPHG